MYNPNVPSSNMGIEPVSSAPSQPLGPTQPMGMAPMGPPPPMMGGMPPPPMGAPMGPPPIAPITEGLGGFGGSRSGRAGFSERMQKMTAPPKPKPQPQQIQQPVQGMQYGGMVPRVPSFGQLSGRMPYLPQRDVSNSALSKSGGGIDQYGEYLEQTYGDPDFDQKRDDFLKNVSQQEQQTFGGGGGGMGGRMGGIGSFAPHVMNQPFMGGALQQGFPSYSMHRQGAFNPFGGRLKFFEDGGEVPRQAEISGQPHMLAYINPEEERLLRGLGGSGNPGPGGIPAYSYEDEAYGGDYGDVDYGGGGDRYTDPYEELDDIYEDVGGYDPTDPHDDGDDGDDNGPAADLVYGGGGGGGRNVKQPVGPNNAQEALDQANADFKDGRGDIADLDLATLSGRISRGSNVMPASLSSIDAVSQNFAVPTPTDTTFSDPDEIFDLSNPISLNTAQVVGPNPRTDASGNLVPGRSNTAADIEAGTLSARNLGPEVMNISPASYGDMSNVNVGQSPVISGMADKPVVGTNFPPAGSSPPSYGDLSVSNATPPAPKMALPGGSARRGILGPKEDVYLDNAMAAAQQVGARNGIQLEVAQPTSGPVFTNPDGTVLTTADSAAINAQARLEAGVANRVRGTATGVDTMALEEAAYPPAFSDDMQPVDDMQNVGATQAALKRAEDDVSALDRIAEARMPTDDMQIVPTAPAQPVPADPSVVPASFTNVDPYEDQSVKDSYYDQLFGDSPKAFQTFGSTLKFLSGGLIDINKLNEYQRKKGLEAFAQTNKLAYENGVVVGVKDPKGKTIRLGPQPPKERNNTGGEDDCPSGFRRVNGVCQPIYGVSANPADDIADDIKRAITPIIRPLDPPTGDVTTDPVADDPSGIDFRRPNYFAGGGAVSDGMGSAIDNFISAMSR